MADPPFFLYGDCCGLRVFTCDRCDRRRQAGAAERRALVVLARRRHSVGNSRSRCHRVWIRRRIRGSPGPQRVEPLTSDRCVVRWRALPGIATTTRDLRVPSICLPFSCNGIPWSVGCHDQRRPRSGVLLAVQQRKIFLSLPSGRGVTYWCGSFFFATRDHRHRERNQMALVAIGGGGGARDSCSAIQRNQC